VLWGIQKAGGKENLSFPEAKRQGRVDKAESRAVDLLLKTLPPDLGHRYCYTATLPAVGHVTGRTYLIRRKETVLELDCLNEPVYSYCIHSSYEDRLPHSDDVLALWFLITAHEHLFLKTANRSQAGGLFDWLFKNDTFRARLRQLQFARDHADKLYDLALVDVPYPATHKFFTEPERFPLSLEKTSKRHKPISEDFFAPYSAKPKPSYDWERSRRLLGDTDYIRGCMQRHIDRMMPVVRRAQTERERIRSETKYQYPLENIARYRRWYERGHALICPTLDAQGRWRTPGLATYFLLNEDCPRACNWAEIPMPDGLKRVPIIQWDSFRDVDEAFLLALLSAFTQLKHTDCIEGETAGPTIDPYHIQADYGLISKAIMSLSTYHQLTGAPRGGGWRGHAPIEDVLGCNVVVDDRADPYIFFLPEAAYLGVLFTANHHWQTLKLGLAIAEPRNVIVRTYYNGRLRVPNLEMLMDSIYGIFPKDAHEAMEYDMMVYQGSSGLMETRSIYRHRVRGRMELDPMSDMPRFDSRQLTSPI
jgi:hypothetical protein